MKYKIGIFGSAIDESSQSVQMAHDLGNKLGKLGDSIILINGACSGMPHEVLIAARDFGLQEAWGYSSEISLEAFQKAYPNIAVSLFSKLFYVPMSFELVSDGMARKKYRNVSSTGNCDAGIIISGRWGTLNEFTNLHDMGKVIGVLTGTGGVADELQGLYLKIQKPSKAIVIFDDNPSRLVDRILNEVKRRKS
jgi:hypothetical protein